MGRTLFLMINQYRINTDSKMRFSTEIRDEGWSKIQLNRFKDSRD
jgi:hypothetical protein